MSLRVIGREIEPITRKNRADRADRAKDREDRAKDREIELFGAQNGVYLLFKRKNVSRGLVFICGEMTA